MITGLFTLQHRERERGREIGKEREKRERRWFPDVKWNSEPRSDSPPPLYKERSGSAFACCDGQYRRQRNHKTEGRGKRRCTAGVSERSSGQLREKK